MPALSRVGTAFFLNKPGGAGGGGASVGEAVFHADQGIGEVFLLKLSHN